MYHKCLDQYGLPEDVLFQKLEGEAVLLNLTSELYYGLDEVGCRMFELIINLPSLKIAYDTLLEEFKVEPIQLQKDFDDLVNVLIESTLIIPIKTRS